jgi:PilZ domain
MIRERRRFKRVEKPYITRFRVKPDEVQDVVPTDWDMIAVNDLCAGGVFFNASRNLEIGTILDLRISFSTSTHPVKCVGRVARVKKHLNTFIFGIVTEFTETDEDIQEMINASAEKTVKKGDTGIGPMTAPIIVSKC